MGGSRIFFGNLKGEDLLGDSIKMDLKEMAWKDVDWIHPIQDYGKLASSCKYRNEPFDSIKCKEFLSKCTISSFSRGTLSYSW
jgi:hypothetical protein